VQFAAFQMVRSQMNGDFKKKRKNMIVFNAIGPNTGGQTADKAANRQLCVYMDIFPGKVFTLI